MGTYPIDHPRIYAHGNKPSVNGQRTFLANKAVLRARYCANTPG